MHRVLVVKKVLVSFKLFVIEIQAKPSVSVLKKHESKQ